MFHASQIKPHVGPVPDIEPQVILGEDDADDEYEVEQVLDVCNVKRGHTIQKQYLVLWKGYLLAEATWEPEANLKNAPDIVKQFWVRTSSTK